LNYKKLEIETASVLKEALGLYRKFGFKDYDKQNLSADRCDIAMHMHLA
jgi:N-acetylglutamate synthase-like GNAT family acetyltransferase